MLQNTNLIKQTKKINAIDEIQINVAIGYIKKQINHKQWIIPLLSLK